MEGSTKVESNSLIGGMFRMQDKIDTSARKILQDKMADTPVDLPNIKVTTNEKGGPLICVE